MAEFTVSAGDRVPFTLTWYPSHQPEPPPPDPEAALRQTEDWWRKWSGRCTYDGEWREAVVRSLITLKALTYAPTGGLVAAATTSLPERLGGVRNWDYRYCWFRDATFALYALMTGGYVEEARSWREWLWRQLREAIHDDVCQNGYDRDLGAFVQSYASKSLDASLLMIPLVGFLPATDPRMLGTVQAIEQHLVSDGLVARYQTVPDVDGLPPGEGAFLPCTFWLADNLVLQGRDADSEDLRTPPRHPQRRGTSLGGVRAPLASGCWGTSPRRSPTWGSSIRRGTSLATEGQRSIARRRGQGGTATTRQRSDGPLRALRVWPVQVEELAARRVDALVGVRAEVIALGLEEVGGEPRRAVAVEVGQRAAEGGHGDAVPHRERHDLAPGVLAARRSARLKYGSSIRFTRPGFAAVGLGDLLEEARADDAAAAPDGGDLAEVELPVVLLLRLAP